MLLAVCAGLMAWQLFVPPALGVADNGDFAKLIGRACLGGEHPMFEYAAFEYVKAPGNCWNSGLVTSAALPFGIVLAAVHPFSPGRFDLRWLGAVYATLFLAAFAILLRLTRARLAVAAPVILIFCSASYVPWFSSFYFDTASYVFLWFALLAAIRLMFRETVSAWDYWITVLAVILFATSKSQHTMLALPTIACFWLSFARPAFPGLAARLAATALIVAASVTMYATVPASYQTVSTWNALFYRALPHSHNSTADLAAIGLDTAMKRYVGQHAFLPDSPMQDPREVESLGRVLTAPRLARYYAGHPRVAALVFRDALAEGALQRVRMRIGARQYRLGNYEKSAGKPPEAQSRFLDFWSEWKAAAFGNCPLLYGAWTVALLAALWILSLRQSRLRARFVALAAIWTAMVVLAAALVMFDAVDTGRHLFLFNAMLDMTVCGLVAILSLPLRLWARSSVG